VGPERIQRLIAAHRQAKVDMQGLFEARRNQRLVGAAWGQVIPGRNAFCWPARLVPGEPAETARQLYEAVDAYLRQRQVSLVQAVLPPRAIADAAALVKIGFHHLADLDYLVCVRERFPGRLPPLDVALEPCGSAAADRLARVIGETYVDSLDCPDLDGTRSLEDVLAGYRQTGQHRSDWWLLARHGRRDVGCLLLTDHPESGQAEVLYLGLVPSARGHGWGMQMTRFAQWLIGRESRERIVLAVDDANWPALGMYLASGFVIFDRRCVYVRSV
jgi:ribosomal protein S18 acetylase RimI-like enzyme